LAPKSILAAELGPYAACGVSEGLIYPWEVAPGKMPLEKYLTPLLIQKIKTITFSYLKFGDGDGPNLCRVKK